MSKAQEWVDLVAPPSIELQELYVEVSRVGSAGFYKWRTGYSDYGPYKGKKKEILFLSPANALALGKFLVKFFSEPDELGGKKDVN
jgi:hypothetical protein